MHRIWSLSILLLTLVSSAHAQQQAWLRHRAQLQQDPSVLAVYTFEDVAADATKIPNERGADYPLAFNLVPHGNAPAQKLEFVPGRWPEKKAVRLDMGRLEGPEIPVADRAFTASCWFRSNGPGVHRGKNRDCQPGISCVRLGANNKLAVSFSA